MRVTVRHIFTPLSRGLRKRSYFRRLGIACLGMMTGLSIAVLFLLVLRDQARAEAEPVEQRQNATPSATTTSALTPTTTFTSTVEGALDTPAPPSTATATLIPLPTITFIYPERTPTQELLAVERQTAQPALPNGSQASGLVKLVRLIPIGALIVIWAFLGIWFVIAQRQVNRD